MSNIESPDKSARIVIVDDEEKNVSVLSRFLKNAGYANCFSMTDASHLVAEMGLMQPDLILLDLHMEPISGLDVLHEITRKIEMHLRPPVLVLTADSDNQAKRSALAAGATDFLAKPLDEVELLLRVEHLLQTRRLFQRCQRYSMGLEKLVADRTAELEKALGEVRATQRQLIHQERIRALGTMASGIAHDLNNSLSLILGYGDLLLANEEKFPAGSEERRNLEQIVMAGVDNSNMVKRLREFYRPNDPTDKNTLFDLNAIVATAVALTEPRWKIQSGAQGAAVRVSTDLGRVPKLLGNPSEIREVLVNLIFNSVDAMPHGGEIRARTYEADGSAFLEVSDTGTGMSEDVLDHCLDPFFTTKAGKGTGLGLSMSFGIIRRHHGSIKIETVLNAGTKFIIQLPAPDANQMAASASEPGPMRALNILVVHDQENICEIMKAYLAEDHHTVETAHSARTAIQKLLSGAFDLVITDRMMERMNGNELAASIKRCKPHKPVIMMTGFPEGTLETREPIDNVDFVLEKPAQLNDIRRAVAQAMGKAG